jgi:tetratricopeptide (TPR) repeat protein
MFLRLLNVIAKPRLCLMAAAALLLATVPAADLHARKTMGDRLIEKEKDKKSEKAQAYAEYKKFEDEVFAVARQGKFTEAEKMVEADMLTSQRLLLDQLLIYNLRMMQPSIEDALLAAKKASEIDPTFGLSWLSVARAYDALGKPQEALAACSSLLENCTDKTYKRQAQVYISHLKQYLALNELDSVDYYRSAAPMGEALEFYGNRLSFTLPLGMIPVYIKEPENVRNYRTEYKAIVCQAFKDWSDALDGKVQFGLVPRPDTAKIWCKFTNNEGDKFSADAAAQTGYGDAWSVQRRLILLRPSEIDVQQIGDDDMRGKSLHEIGHALGLHGHSPNPKDIMFWLTVGRHDLSARDIATMRRLYKLQPKVTYSEAPPQHSTVQSASPAR